MKTFWKGKDKTNVDALCKACTKVDIKLPNKLSWKFSAIQIKNILINLAIAASGKKKESQRYLYFAKQFKNLNTNPQNILSLICMYTVKNLLQK